mmetsp:Transcript_3750/g.6384  ORF Transcript_3750/g.6384 Transcript_3750/m.6384 type:complete len:281 (+) Transcript_3750:15-857(+)
MILGKLAPPLARVVRRPSLPSMGIPACRACSNSNIDPYPHGLPDRVVVYGRTTSRVQKVLYMLEELRVPCERVFLQSPAPAFFKDDVNPLGLVPAIRDQDVILADSNAICAYLAHKYGRDDGFYPADAAGVGKALQWSDFIENYLATPRFNIVFHALINNQYPPSFRRPGRPSDEEIDQAIDATVHAFGILDRHLSCSAAAGRDMDSTPTFIDGQEHFSFADAVAAPWLHRWHCHASVGEFGQKLAPERFKSVLRYHRLLEARPAFQSAILGVGTARPGS